MPTTRYTVLAGRIVYENRLGIAHDYVSDALGSTLALLSAGQSVSDVWSYYPYGESIRAAGSTATTMLFCGTVGCRQDSSAKRSSMRQRLLDTEAARWLTEDPVRSINGELNLYRYANSSPATYYDPTGTVCARPTGCDERQKETCDHCCKKVKIPTHDCTPLNASPPKLSCTCCVMTEMPSYSNYGGNGAPCSQYDKTADSACTRKCGEMNLYNQTCQISSRKGKRIVECWCCTTIIARGLDC